MKRYLYVSLFSALLFTACQTARRASVTNAFINGKQWYADAADQYRYLAQKRPKDRFPKTYYPVKDSFEWSNSKWWCSGFYPGTLLYLYEQTGDTALGAEAGRMLQLLEREQYNKTTHDLGFMMFCSFGNALQIKPDPRYREILLNSARSLLTRFDPKVGCIRSWDSKKKEEFIVIIDNMMNLELLFWATRETGDSSFYKAAVTHANTTLQHHFRDDHSSYHLVVYDATTGGIREKKTAQGYSNASAWARGQAWGLYGYTVMFRETGDTVYLRKAEAIAQFILPKLPADKVPYWDHDAPGKPEVLRDASAGAVMASALFELSGYAPANKDLYLGVATQCLQSLGSETYRAANGNNGGYLLKHSVGHKPAGTEVDVPLTYADYYFIEALKRYQKLKH